MGIMGVMGFCRVTSAYFTAEQSFGIKEREINRSKCREIMLYNFAAVIDKTKWIVLFLSVPVLFQA